MMGSRLLRPLLAAALVGLSGSPRAATSLHDDLTALAQDFTYTTAALFPTQATQLGIPWHDGELEKPSEANRSAYIVKLQQWQNRLEQLGPFDNQPLTDRDDALLLRAQLVTSRNALLARQTDRKDY